MHRHLPCLYGLLWCLSIVTALRAHDLHQSTAEVEFNAATKRLEVSLNVFVDDLELALMRQAERELPVTTTANALVDAEIQHFLMKHFVIKDEAGKVAGIVWTGREIDAETATGSDPEVTLYFEVPLPGGMAGATLSHTVFCDRFADQLNLVHVRHGAQSTQLSFGRNDAAKRLMVTP